MRDLILNFQTLSINIKHFMSFQLQNNLQIFCDFDEL